MNRDATLVWSANREELETSVHTAVECSVGFGVFVVVLQLVERPSANSSTATITTRAVVRTNTHLVLCERRPVQWLARSSMYVVRDAVTPWRTATIAATNWPDNVQGTMMARNQLDDVTWKRPRHSIACDLRPHHRSPHHTTMVA